MLQSLSIRDFIIVHQLDLELKAGFTVLTGETGAGKSILIDALSLALGARAEGGVIRAGCDKAEISAYFSVANNTDAKVWLNDNEMQAEDSSLLMRRVIYSDGRSRAFINGYSATVTQLKELGELLVDIYSQNAHHSLLSLTTQRQVLDNFSGLSPLAFEVENRYKVWHRLHLQRIESEKNAVAYAEELAELRDAIRELSQTVLSPQEWQELQQEHQRLAHTTHLMVDGEACREWLSEGEFSASRLLLQVQHKLQNMCIYDSAITESAEALDSVIIQLDEIDRFLNRYLQKAELDPARLDAVEVKMQNVHNLARKHRVSPDALTELLTTLQERMTQLELFANDELLAQEEAQALADYMESALRLSDGRQSSAQALSMQISAEMQRLSMGGGRFEVALTQQQVSASGLEQVEFLVSGHAGITPRALNKVASGGELSRISLAIRVATAQQENIPTMIFDEVDVGIGGGVAEVIGQLLKKLCDKSSANPQHQVLVITHLPQVAALGEHHLRVSKTLEKQQVSSTIALLDDVARIEEVARMLGGVELTATTRQHAKEMLAG